MIVLHRDRLSYDTWTSILPDKATPAQAQTDLPLGKARIPKNWSLKLVAMPANFLCMLHHDHCHVAVSKLFPFTLITKHHRVARIFWLSMLMTTSCRCEMRPLIWPEASLRPDLTSICSHQGNHISVGFSPSLLHPIPVTCLATHMCPA